MADRYLMLPSVGAILAVCGACSWIAAKRRTRQIAVIAALLVIAAAYAAAARQRTAVWIGATTPRMGKPNPDLSIWTAAVETDPNDLLAMTNLATVHLGFDPPETDKAIDLLRRALEIAEGKMKIADGKTFDTTQMAEGLADAYMAKARGMGPAPDGADRKREVLLEALKYFERANRSPMAFAPMRARFLRNMSDAQEQVAKTEPDPGRREALRGGAVQALEEARRLLVGAGASRDDPDFRDTILSLGTAYFGRGNAGGPE
jgi:hypothetical protein